MSPIPDHVFNGEVSGSSIIKDFLMSKDIGYCYCAEDMQKSLSDQGHTWITTGMVNGFSTRLIDEGFASGKKMAKSGHNRKILFYTIDHDISSIKVNAESTVGGAIGRQIARRNRKYFTKQTIIERLNELAAEIEKIETPLSSFSTEALLAELLKRQKAQAKAS